MTRKSHALITAVAAAVTLAATPVIADDADSTASAGVPVCLYDNGDTDQVNGFSNQVGEPGSRRTVLDDFTVPSGETWRLTGLRNLHVWDTLPPGSGTGMEIDLRSDDGGMPGAVLQTLVVNDYMEIGTGRMQFTRDEAESWSTIDPVDLPTGTYWFEATVVGPENNFWLSAPVQGNECWVNYEDGGGLRSSTELPPIGTPLDLAWCISGEVLRRPARRISTGTCPSTSAICWWSSGSWGPCEEPCPPCAEDLDGDCQIAFGEILAILGAWGPCKP